MATINRVTSFSIRISLQEMGIWESFERFLADPDYWDRELQRLLTAGNNPWTLRRVYLQGQEVPLCLK